jgi:hypothetical protein
MSSAKSASKAEKRVVMEPLRPRRNPNRKGYQAVAAGEKRTAGEIEGEPKSASKKSKAPNMYIFVVWFLYQFQPRFDQRNF